MDTDTLKNYTPRNVPSIASGQAVFLKDELQRISTALNELVRVAKLLDARLVGGGL